MDEEKNGKNEEEKKRIGESLKHWYEQNILNDGRWQWLYSMDVSLRDRKIFGDFGELMISNWLSKCGFEVFHVDHVGLDLIGYNKIYDRRIGITVKSRRTHKTSYGGQIAIFNNKKKDKQKLIDACKSLKCEPWIAIYAEHLESADIYLTSLKHFDEKICKYPGANVCDTWSLAWDRSKDPYVKHVHFQFSLNNWLWQRIDFENP